MRISFGLNDLPVVLQAHADLYGWRHTLRRVQKVVHDLLRQRYRVARQDRGPRRRGKALLVFHFRMQSGVLGDQAVCVGVSRFIWLHPQMGRRLEQERRTTDWMTFDATFEPVEVPNYYDDAVEYVADILRILADEARDLGCAYVTTFLPEHLAEEVALETQRWRFTGRTGDRHGNRYVEMRRMLGAR